MDSNWKWIGNPLKWNMKWNELEIHWNENGIIIRIHIEIQYENELEFELNHTWKRIEYISVNYILKNEMKNKKINDFRMKY